MDNQRLKILFDMILNTDEDEEDIRAYFISLGEDPDAIIKQALDFVKQKTEEIKSKLKENEQNN